MNVLQKNWNTDKENQLGPTKRAGAKTTQHYYFIDITLEHLLHFTRLLMNPDSGQFLLQSDASR